MLNRQSMACVRTRSMPAGQSLPLYDSYAFAQIPATVERLLCGASGGLPEEATAGLSHCDLLVTVCIDGFGWRYFEKYAESYPLLRRILSDGVASMITSQFPSTTVAHMTCLHTGQPVGKSGFYEWYQYEPLAGEIIAPLLFSYAGDVKRGTLSASGLTPQEVYPLPSFYAKLWSQGVRTEAWQACDCAFSPYSAAMFGPAKMRGFTSPQEACASVAARIETLEATALPSYFFLYLHEIDSASHRYGPDSPFVDEVVDQTMRPLELVASALDKYPGRSALVLIADHGQTAVDLSTTVYLNRVNPGIVDWLERGRSGRPLAPAGSSRDLFLHIRPEALATAQEALAAQLAGIAEVVSTETLMKRGLFGPEISARFRQRVGNLALLPAAHQNIWWHEKGRFDCHFPGMHGGLSSEEMESVFLFLPT